MKTLLFALSLICLTLAYDLSLPPVVLFNQYITNEKIKFASDAEAQARFVAFQNNLEIIKELNSKQISARFGITKFAHYTPEEFKSIFLTLKTPVRDQEVPEAPTVSVDEVNALPESWDWVSKGAVTAVKDQGQCGSCWTFSTTGNIEGQWFLSNHSLVSLSEQNIVDCDHLCANGSCDSGCNGGLMGTAFDFVLKQGGIDSEASYPYTAEDGTCKFQKSDIVAHISGWNFVNPDEGQMAAFLVANGPISVAVDATSWQFYLGGVLQSPIPCGTTLDHGVLVVGYGTETNIIGETVDFWKIKNSWGSSWGESGYIRIERGTGYCGVNQYPCSSFVKD